MNFSAIHQRALLVSSRLRTAEREMILLLQEIDADRGYRELGFTSLSAYMIGALSFSEASAHHFISVSRKSTKVPELQCALLEDRITLSKAKTLVPVITRENSAHWLELASRLTVRELEREVAKEHPEALRKERFKHRSKDHVDLEVTLREPTMELLKRAQELLKQSKNANVPLAEALHEIATFFVERHDPLLKAAKKSPLSRSEREKALLRDKGSCQFTLTNGKKCLSRYWLDVHHIRPKSRGGNDTVENLITLCSAHHRMMHAPPSPT